VDGPAPTCLSADPGPGPSFGGEHRPFEWGKRAVGLCSPCLDGEGGCAGGGVPLGAVPVLSWCGEVSLGGIQSSSSVSLVQARAVFSRPQSRAASEGELGLCKIFVYSKAFSHYAIILVLLPPPALLTLLQYYRTTIAQYTTPTRSPLRMPYTIQDWQLQYRVKAKGERVGCTLAFTRYCRYQYRMVNSIHKKSRGRVVYCVIVVQSYCNSVGNAGGRVQ